MKPHNRSLVQDALAELELTILRPSDVDRLLRNLPPAFAKKGRTKFLDALLAEGLLRRLTLDATPYRTETRYLRGNPSRCEIALTLRPHSYLSHGTALYLHGLTAIQPPAEPTEIILNQEQSAKPEPTGDLTQAGIDRAFAACQRLTNYRFRSEGFEILLTNGKASGNLGVIDLPGPGGVLLKTTDLERTFIDSVVRPAYAGGVGSVLAATQRAVDRLSIPRLVKTLRALEHRYPYHQSLGFLLEKAGFTRPQLKPLHDLGTAFDFHLQHGVLPQERTYSPYWRLHHPQDL